LYLATANQASAIDQPDVTLLAVGSDADELERAVRDVQVIHSAPIIVMVTRQQLALVAGALDSGATDYIVKPLSFVDLRCKIRAALRAQNAKSQPQRNCFKCGDLSIDIAAQTVLRSGSPIQLSDAEWRLLKALIAHSNLPLTDKCLCREISGDAPAADEASLRCLAAGLRRKIEPDPVRSRYFLAEPGIGYRVLTDQPSESSGGTA
jgi:two-component system KDP operon response regulator KdpE